MKVSRSSQPPSASRLLTLASLSVGLNFYLLWESHLAEGESWGIALILVVSVLLLARGLGNPSHPPQGKEEPPPDSPRGRDPFFNNSVTLMCIADTDGYLQVANPAFERILGWTPEAMQGKRIDQMVHPDDVAIVLDSFERLAQGETLVNIEHRHRCRDGAYRWLSWNLFPVLETGKIYGLAQDIEVCKQAQNQQAETNHLLQSILDSTNDLTAAMDTEFRYLAFTRAYQQEFKKVFGYELEVGMKLHTALAHLPREQADAVAVWERALRGEEYTIQAEFGDPNRERHYYELTYKTIRNVAGDITGVVQIGREITQRQQALNTLEARQQEFTLAENSPDVIARYDRHYRHLYINPAVEVSMGLSREVLWGKSLSEVGYPEDFTKMWEGWLAKAFQGEGSLREMTQDTPDGPKSYQTRIVPELDEAGEVHTVLTITRDITPLKEIEQQLRKSELLLSEAQALTHLGSWELDLKTQELVWSKEMYHIFGLDPNQPVPPLSEHEKLFHPDDWKTVLQTAQGLQTEGTPQKFEYRIIRPNGEIRYLEGQGKVFRNQKGEMIKAIGTAFDLTERKRAENALQKLTEELEARVEERTAQLQASETRFRAAIENAPFPIVIHAEDGEIVQINKVWTELTGYTLAEIPTVADWTEKAYGERKEVVKEVIDQLYTLNERVAEGEYPLRTHWGQVKVVSKLSREFEKNQRKIG